MENNPFPLPERKNYEVANELAYKIAGERLNGIEDIAAQCGKSGAWLEEDGRNKSILLEFLSRTYRITFPDVEIALKDSDEEVPLTEKLLILHYFISAKGTPMSSKLITFRELPEGNVYYPTFLKRTVNPLVKQFSDDLQLLIDAGEKFGGEKGDHGDSAVTIKAFPCIQITLIIWQGDEELTPQGNVVFDSTISDYLPTEDITILCETLTRKLVRSMKG